ncbi:CopG family ribbon-helix-helix protein [Candidatus Methylomicrobium oryzae]|uniref:CopG family ribbon-helix-helix protein n=1 Tax=Candidatus Methylomicrobium oryzae TaxID=2802053 RepID=UPI001921ECAB|nr:hypothetical protein [Methylomicrobium sp. RS1]MBL1265841.1 hypothetical protein [Methylomicrobium sp. RS1]
MNKAIKEDLERHVEQIEKIAEGIAAADRGEVLAHDDVMSEMESLIAKKLEETDENCLDQAKRPIIQKD